ncbi:MAG: PIN domain-containing protein [Deltaproteobacteria bacterium]
MKAVDSSVVIAAFASWHERHDAARGALDRGARTVEHCTLEALSVLTRLPPPHRAPVTLVRDFLRGRFPKPFLRLGARAYRQFLFGLPELGLAGGAVYDALIAATAAEHGAQLLSCDRRAVAHYERYGISFELI